MTTLTVHIRDDLKKRMDEHPEIDWHLIGGRALNAKRPKKPSFGDIGVGKKSGDLFR
jgi:hypothetical protein